MSDRFSKEEDDRDLQAWLDGGSPMPLLERLVSEEREDEAATYARLALADDDCEERDRVEGVLERVASAPDGWSEALVQFATDPSVEAWDDLMRFTPEDAFYQRTRYTIEILQRLGVDPQVLFRCATRFGISPEAIGLAESGAVDPEVVAHRAAQAPLAAGLWLGLAAQAAQARGDRFAVVRYLRQAFSETTPPYPLDSVVAAVREKADSELQEMLDKVGVPRS